MLSLCISAHVYTDTRTDTDTHTTQIHPHVHTHTHAHTRARTHTHTKLSSEVALIDLRMYIPYSGFYLRGPNLCELCETLWARRI